jgi:hypothetical protein
MWSPSTSAPTTAPRKANATMRPSPTLNAALDLLP